MTAMILEPENRAEKGWMSKFMNADKVMISQATGLAAALDNLVTIVESGLLDIVFVDSLAALAVKELKAKGTEGDHMALVARRLPQFFQIATEPVATTKTAVVFTHQMRASMDMYSGELETYNGGNALKHWLSLVLNMRRASTSRDSDKGERFVRGDGGKLGFMTNFKCIKGGIGSIREGDSIQLDFFFNKGFVDDTSIVHFAIRNKILEKPGVGVYSFTDKEGTYEGRGIVNVVNDFGNNPELRDRLLNHCKLILQSDTYIPASVDVDNDFEKEMINGSSEVEQGGSTDANENEKTSS